MTGWLKLKLMGLITFINAAIGVTLGGLLYTIWPDHYFKWYPSIPIFYWVMAIVMTYILDRKKRKNGDVTITAFISSTEKVHYWCECRFLSFIMLNEKKRMKREKKENDEQYQK